MLCSQVGDGMVSFGDYNPSCLLVKLHSYLGDLGDGGMISVGDHDADDGMVRFGNHDPYCLLVKLYS